MSRMSYYVITIIFLAYLCKGQCTNVENFDENAFQIFLRGSEIGKNVDLHDLDVKSFRRSDARPIYPKRNEGNLGL